MTVVSLDAHVASGGIKPVEIQQKETYTTEYWVRTSWITQQFYALSHYTNFS